MFAKHCVRTLMVALLVCGGTACGSDGGTSTQKSSACARFFTFEGREYRDVGDFPVEAGRRVGTAVQPALRSARSGRGEEGAGQSGL
ncbi:hypothetical protein GA0115255_106152 [Streptomyces sp. Ncost-T6T-2b]|nr:hypothetical protein GA0115255_106152 [Streptomyces sp. Ncost-T6T-2b]